MSALTGPHSERVLLEVSRRVQTDPSDFSPSFSASDPAALDATADGMAEGTVQFSYAGHVVAVHENGTGTVADRFAGGKDRTKPAAED